MLKDLLGDLYTDEIAAKIGDTKLVVDDGKLIPYDRFQEVNDQLKGFQEQLAQRDTQLEELKKADPSALEAKIKELQEQNQQAKTDFDASLTAAKLDFAVEARLLKEGAVNPRAVKALLDTGKISLDGENLAGLDEQLAALKESEKWAFTPPANPVPGAGGNPAGKAEGKSLRDEISQQIYGQGE